MRMLGNPKARTKPKRHYANLLFSFGKCGIVIQVEEETRLVHNLSYHAERLVRIEDWWESMKEMSESILER